MAKGFAGFPEELFVFLSDLAKNNKREWFNEHKQRYREAVVYPVSDFIEQFAPKLEKISPRFIADPRPHGGSMFRIYRDTRFSKDKRPYKEHVGCHFKHQAGKNAHAPGFYLHLEPGKVMMGGGIWQPPNEVLDRIRRRIVEQPEAWAKLGSKKIKAQYGGVQGDGLKRPPRGYSAEHEFIEDIKRKSYYLMREVDQHQAMSSSFMREIDKTYKDISPLVQFITDALDLPFE